MVIKNSVYSQKAVKSFRNYNSNSNSNKNSIRNVQSMFAVDGNVNKSHGNDESFNIMVRPKNSSKRYLARPYSSTGHFENKSISSELLKFI